MWDFIWNRIRGFPEAVIEAVVVEQRAIGLGVGLALAFDGVFGNELPIELAGAGFEQFVKRGADGGFVFDAELRKLGERIVIGAYGLVRWLEGQARHEQEFATSGRRRQVQASASKPGFSNFLLNMPLSKPC
jgi:hypothetical protein